MSRRLVVACVLVLTAGLSSRAQAQTTLTLQQVLTMARERAPRVAVARARIDEARGRLAGAQVRFRDNPVFDAASGPRWLETQTVTDYELGLSQVFELGGQRAARIDAAQAGIARETAVADASIRQILRDVAVAFVRALAARTRAETLRSAHGLATEALTVAERRYRAGDIAILDVNVARVAVARALAQGRTAEADLTVAIGELKALLGWAEAGEPEVVGDLLQTIRDGLSILPVPAAEHPEARVLAAEIVEGEATLRLGRALKTPDLGVGFTFKREEAHQAASAGASVVLPLFSKGQEQRVTGAAQSRRAELERAAVIADLDIRARAAQAAFRLRIAATEPIERDVLPGLEENERLARRSFEVGELSLPDLLIIRREFIETRLQYLETLSDAAAASIEWQVAAGVLR
jgi:cobalt-zinc-cadmium efflux system outer membrane protein